MNLRAIAALAIMALPGLAAAQDLTLETIMADPDWLGNKPENAFWGADSRTVFFEQKRQGSELRDLYSVDTTDGAIAEIAEAHWSRLFRSSVVYSQAGDLHAWVYEGDIFFSDGDSTHQVTRTSAAESEPMFMADARRVAFQRDGQYFVFDPATGLAEQVTDIRFEKDPADEEDFDVLRAHQERLYEQLRKAESDKDEARERKRALFDVDEGLGAKPFYMDDKVEGLGQWLSPGGRWLLVTTRDKSFDEGKSGTMPNYVSLDGHVATREVRTRVGRTGRAPQTVWLIDLEQDEKHELTLDELPGIKDDPLADLRAGAIEHFVGLGEDREKAKKRLEAPETRGVEVYNVHWAADGSNAALWVHANDNKDRWIATIDFDRKQLESEHRLSDEAWVNNYYPTFGWLRDNETIWFLSEDHGYIGIYTKNTRERRGKALVAGEYVVFNPVLGPSGKYIYYRTNVEHPGVYEAWRVDVGTGKAEQLTALGGMNDVIVSPDESQLLIVHSELGHHDDLFVQENRPRAEARQLTDTMSDAYKAIDWQQPAIVAVPSSHVDKPIYAKIYVPENHDPAKTYPAVMFVHGAGYLQNSDYGWPDYYREHMFHNLLAQHGYVVIDMDYRASRGYGRDWRAAIYRRMGVPELEDFHDGIDYLVEHYGVDRERVGIYGGSYGGFMAFVAMFKSPGTFQAGAGLRPVTDWTHYAHHYTSNILNTPDIDPEAYYISSPINFAEGLEGALLIASGMQDDNVFFQDSVLLVQRLIELKKENFEIAIYPQDPHGFVHPESWLDEYRRIFRLFEDNL